MPVLVDTGLLVGAIASDDPHHVRSRAILKDLAGGKRGALVTTDHVASEAITRLRRRPGLPDVSRAFIDLVFGAKPAFKLVTTVEEQMREAAALHLKHYDRRLSFVDCTLLVHAERLGAPLATLDSQFDGLVDIVR